MKNYLLATSLALLFTSCGSSSSSNTNLLTEIEDTNTSDTSETNNTVTYSGKIVDGYIKGAIVYIDINNNELFEEEEPNTISDYTGNFTIKTEQTINNTMKLRAYGGIDIDNGLDFESELVSSIENKDATNKINITPLTTLVIETMKENKISFTIAKERVAVFMDLNIDELNLDPVAQYEINPAIYKQNKLLIELSSRLQENNSDILSTSTTKDIFVGLSKKINGINNIETINNISINEQDISIEEELIYVKKKIENIYPVIPLKDNTDLNLTAWHSLPLPSSFHSIGSDYLEDTMINEVKNIADGKHYTQEELKNIEEELYTVGTQLMQSFVFLNSALFVDPEKISKEETNQRFEDAKASLLSLQKETQDTILKLESRNSLAVKRYVKRILKRDSETLGDKFLDIIQNSAQKALEETPLYKGYKAIDKTMGILINQATIIAESHYSQETVAKRLEQLEDGAIAIKEASALTIQIYGMTVSGGVLNPTLAFNTLTKMAQAGKVFTIATEGLSAITTSIKITSAGADLFIGRGNEFSKSITSSQNLKYANTLNDFLGSFTTIVNVSKLTNLGLVRDPITNKLTKNAVELVVVPFSMYALADKTITDAQKAKNDFVFKNGNMYATKSKDQLKNTIADTTKTLQKPALLPGDYTSDNIKYSMNTIPIEIAQLFDNSILIGRNEGIREYISSGKEYELNTVSCPGTIVQSGNATICKIDTDGDDTTYEYEIETKYLNSTYEAQSFIEKYDNSGVFGYRKILNYEKSVNSSGEIIQESKYKNGYKIYSYSYNSETNTKITKYYEPVNTKLSSIVYSKEEKEDTIVEKKYYPVQLSTGYSHSYLLSSKYLKGEGSEEENGLEILNIDGSDKFFHYPLNKFIYDQTTNELSEVKYYTRVENKDKTNIDSTITYRQKENIFERYYPCNRIVNACDDEFNRNTCTDSSTCYEEKREENSCLKSTFVLSNGKIAYISEYMLVKNEGIIIDNDISETCNIEKSVAWYTKHYKEDGKLISFNEYGAVLENNIWKGAITREIKRVYEDEVSQQAYNTFVEKDIIYSIYPSTDIDHRSIPKVTTQKIVSSDGSYIITKEVCQHGIDKSNGNHVSGVCQKTNLLTGEKIP